MTSGGWGEFRLLDPECFEYGRRDGDGTQFRLCPDTLRFVASAAAEFARLYPVHAGPFAAFAVTLRTKADNGALHEAGRLPAPHQQEGEPDGL